MAMAMAKIIWRVIKTKHLVTVQKQQISSSSSILFKRVVVSKDGEEENILSLLKYPIIENIGLPCFKEPEYLAIHGYSQGIVCLSDISGDIWLCNPATRAFRKLPPSILLMKMMPETPGAIFTETNAMGFAYVPKSNDFKVVTVVHFMKYGSDFRPDTVQLGVEVYDLSTDRWRGNKISEPPFGAVCTPSFEICHNGIYYWCGSDEGSILSFDMTQELFRPISMPKGFMWSNKDRSLLVWNGCIVLFDYPMSGDDKSFDIWLMVMDGDGSVDWVKLMTIGPLSGIVRPLLFTNSDQQLIMEAKDGHVVSYNLLTKQIKDLPIKGEPDRIQCFHFQNTESMSNVSKAWKTLP